MIPSFFTDPVMATPLLGAILISTSLALIGSIFFLRKESLLGESLSHAAYPGVLLGSLVAGGKHIGMLVGGVFTSSLAYGAITFLTSRKKVSSDSALLSVLSVFFGFGVVIASKMQFSHPKAYQSIFGYLYGQSALITEDVVKAYLYFFLIFALFLVIFFRPIRMILFDSTEAKLRALPTKFLEWSLFLFLLISIVFGIRNVGIILLSGMLIAPAVAARQWTHRLSLFFLCSGMIAATSAVIGSFLSFAVHCNGNYLPLGPSIILTAVVFAFLSLLIAPERGFLFRGIRIISFRMKCLRENIIKAIYKETTLPLEELQKRYPSKFWLRYQLLVLQRRGYLIRRKDNYILTDKGITKAISIVRLHRLWELFLTDQLGIDKNKVHSSAEEMEHVLTREIEERLDHLLENPTKDPHEQPIPPARHV